MRRAEPANLVVVDPGHIDGGVRHLEAGRGGPTDRRQRAPAVDPPALMHVRGESRRRQRLPLVELPAADRAFQKLLLRIDRDEPAALAPAPMSAAEACDVPAPGLEGLL